MNTAKELASHKPFIEAKRKIHASLLKLGQWVDWMTAEPKIYNVYEMVIDSPAQRLKFLKSYERLLLSNRVGCSDQERWFIDWQLAKTQEEYTIIMKKLNWERSIKRAEKSGQPIESFISLSEIRDIPITKILDITPNKPILCLWHNDKHPSLRLHPKKNRVKCFSCGKYGSIIDVYIAQKQCSVGEAIKNLSKLI
jgi:hypothetical protein